jgi:hypothetical protein
MGESFCIISEECSSHLFQHLGSVVHETKIVPSRLGLHFHRIDSLLEINAILSKRKSFLIPAIPRVIGLQQQQEEEEQQTQYHHTSKDECLWMRLTVIACPTAFVCLNGGG